MSNTQEKKVKRIIDATEEQWTELVALLFKMGINVPIEPFNFELYSNSKQSMKHLKASSIHKLPIDDGIQLFLKLAHEFGIDFLSDGENLAFKCDTMKGIIFEILKLRSGKVNLNSISVKNNREVRLEKIEE